MTSAQHPELTLLDAWLDWERGPKGGEPPYCHWRFFEEGNIPDEVWDELYQYIDHAHEGARRSQRELLGDSLHPLSHYNRNVDPAFGYPHRCPDNAKQGFFGEILAGIFAENYVDKENEDDPQRWEVPVYLFKTHVVAFQQLERMKQTDNWNRQIMGRTGDDGLAFERDENNKIVAWMLCEAKCTRTHSAAMIADLHEKLSEPSVDLLRVISALQDYDDDAYAESWISALRQLYWNIKNGADIPRCDLAVYVCGQIPRLRSTWIPVEEPHERYQGRRELNSTELHLPNVVNTINALYGRMEEPS